MFCREVKVKIRVRRIRVRRIRVRRIRVRRVRVRVEKSVATLGEQPQEWEVFRLGLELRGGAGGRGRSGLVQSSGLR